MKHACSHIKKLTITLFAWCCGITTVYASTENPWDLFGPEPTTPQMTEIASQYRNYAAFITERPGWIANYCSEIDQSLLVAWNTAHPPVQHSVVRGVHFFELIGGTPHVLLRPEGKTFTDAAKWMDTGSATEITMNMNLYRIYNENGPGAPPVDLTEGFVRSNGQLVGGLSSPLTFYIAYTEGTGTGPDGGSWSFGAGDPPGDATVAFGGGKPLILNKLPYGPGNTYAASAPPGLPLSGDPGEANRHYLTQRSNKGVAALMKGNPETVGLTAIGANKENDVLIIAVRPDNAPGGVDVLQLRDMLIERGADNALAFDGADSVTLVVDSKVLAWPGPVKNNSTPFGITIRIPQFLDHSPPNEPDRTPSP